MPGDRTRVNRPVVNLAAQNLYLQGRYHLNQRTEEGLRRAVEFFEKAIVEDAQYAQAYSGLADGPHSFNVKAIDAAGNQSGSAGHTWTIDTTPLATALDAAKQAGYDAVELRRTDFKRCFDAGMTNTQVLDLIKKGGIPCGVLGVEYGWLFATGDERKRLFQVFRESCENAVALGCDTLMSAPGQVNGPIKDAIKYLKDAGDIAAIAGIVHRPPCASRPDR
jgi:hypothetical protein